MGDKAEGPARRADGEGTGDGYARYDKSTEGERAHIAEAEVGG